MAQQELTPGREAVMLDGQRLTPQAGSLIRQALQISKDEAVSVRLENERAGTSFGLVSVPASAQSAHRMLFFFASSTGNGQGGPYYSPRYLLIEESVPGRYQSVPSSLHEYFRLPATELQAALTKAESRREAEACRTRELTPFWVRDNHILLAEAVRKGSLVACCASSADLVW